MPANSTRSIIDADDAIGTIIHRRRELAGMSAAALGRAIGLTYQQVRKYEQGTNRVSAGTLMKIAEALGCTAVEIVAEVERARGGAPAPGVSEASAGLARVIEGLPADSRRSLETIVGKLSAAGRIGAVGGAAS